MLCDPDYINQKILAYIKKQEKLMADTKRTYTYAASYEDFVKMINLSESLDELKQMRFVILWRRGDEHGKGKWAGGWGERGMGGGVLVVVEE